MLISIVRVASFSDYITLVMNSWFDELSPKLSNQFRKYLNVYPARKAINLGEQHRLVKRTWPIELKYFWEWKYGFIFLTRIQQASSENCGPPSENKFRPWRRSGSRYGASCKRLRQGVCVLNINCLLVIDQKTQVRLKSFCKVPVTLCRLAPTWYFAKVWEVGVEKFPICHPT